MMTQPVRSSIFVEASKKIYKFFDIHICLHTTFFLNSTKVHTYNVVVNSEKDTFFRSQKKFTITGVHLKLILPSMPL